MILLNYNKITSLFIGKIRNLFHNLTTNIYMVFVYIFLFFSCNMKNLKGQFYNTLVIQSVEFYKLYITKVYIFLIV